MGSGDKIIIEVMYKAQFCLICQYMDETVLETLPAYQDYVEYRRIDILESSGKTRFLELSVSLFGADGVYKKMHIAPVPSLFINGALVFDSIPPRPLLEEVIEEIIAEQFPEGMHEKS